MMKASKLLSIILAIALVFTLCAGVMAEGTDKNDSITVNNAKAGETYNLYKMFDLEVDSDTNPTAFTYTVNTAWSAFFAEGGAGHSYVTIEGGYVTAISDSAALAKAAEAYTSKLGAINSIKATVEKVEFTGLDHGYYLITSTLGTFAMTETTPDKDAVTVNEKNAAPSVTKEVQEDSNNNWGTTNDADINQTVNFRATITVQKGAVNYTLHDTMSTGLTYGSVTAVKIDNADVPQGKYTVKTEGTCGCTFEVVFDNDYIAGLAPDTQINVEYSATLNENAAVGMDGNTNKVVLSYGDTPTYSNEVVTTTYTWDAKVIKFTTKDNKEVMLAGATFKLSADAAGEKVLKFHNLGNNEYEVCAKDACESVHVTDITTDSTGTFIIEGLDAGTYYLTETVAPAGYNLLNEPKTIKITGADDGNYVTLVTKVENNTGSELPSTGGMGTTLFYVLGAILVLVAAVILVVRRRMRAE